MAEQQAAAWLDPVAQYYAGKLQRFDHCERRYAGDMAQPHDDGLYEFTMIVRKGG